MIPINSFFLANIICLGEHDELFRSILDISVHTRVLHQMGRKLDSDELCKPKLGLNTAFSAFVSTQKSPTTSTIQSLVDHSPQKVSVQKEEYFDFDTQKSDRVTLTQSEKEHNCEVNSMDESNPEDMEGVIIDTQKDSTKLTHIITSPKALISKLEEVYSGLGKSIPKRDRLHNNFMKTLKTFLQKDFNQYCPEFATASNEKRLQNFNIWLTSYIQNFFKSPIDSEFNQSLYEGKWEGFQFIFGSFISKDTMKQMITSSREKAYFYGLQKCFKNSSQKKLAIMLKNSHLLYALDYVFQSSKIDEILKLE